MKFKKAFIPLLLTTVMLAGCGSKDKNKSLRKESKVVQTKKQY